MRFIILINSLLITSILTLSANATNKELSEAIQEQTIALGVLAYRDKAQTIERWQPLADYLTQEISGFRFKLVAGNYPFLEQQIQQQNLDFLLTQPSHYVALTYSSELSSPLASMLNKESDNGYALFGGVIFTQQNRDDIHTLQDIKGKTLVTPSKKSLGAYQMQAYELLEHGVFSDPNKINVIETGLPQANAVQAVVNNQADVGFVRSGVIEKLIFQGKLQEDQLKILNQQSFNDFNLSVSTRLYPEWPIASFSHVKPELVKQLLLALLRIDKHSELAQHLNISGFTIAEDYRKIDQLLRALRLPPFEANVQVTLRDIWYRWQSHIVFLMSLIIFFTTLLLMFLWQKNRSLKYMTHQLSKSHEQITKLELAIQQSPVRVMMTNNNNEIEYANQAILAQTGYTFEEVYLKNPRIFASGDTAKSVYQTLWSTVLEGGVWSGDIVNATKEGNKQLLRTTITQIIDQSKGQVGYLCIQKDITSEKQSEQTIHQLSYYDDLTGLPNRNQLTKRLDELISDHIEDHFLLLINIDRFKVINDANGKEIGDQLLRAFSETILNSISGEHFVARLSADEFAIICAYPNHSEQQLTEKSEELLNKLKRPFYINNQIWNLSASIGIAPIARQNNTTLDQVLRHADTALHFAKSEGGNQIQVFNPEIEAKVIEYFQVEQDLKVAIKEGQLALYYQPQVNLSGSLMGAEALVRWHHPTKGLISPDHFISVAEQTDLIVDIGKWIIAHAFEQFSTALKNGFEYDLSVNISPRQFMEPNFDQEILLLTKQFNLPAEKITLEITEGLFLNNIQQVLPVMKQLSQRGFKFSIDDFGTGFSSLSYLKNLPIDELKIDRIFVTNVATDTDDAMLVDTIISIAKHMKFSIVVEGVETDQQSEFFDRFPNILLQGYKYGEPCSFEEFKRRWSHTSLNE